MSSRASSSTRQVRPGCDSRTSRPRAAQIALASRVSDLSHRSRPGRFLGAGSVGDGRDLMGTVSGPYSSLDDQIFACIEAAKTWDKDAKLEDFQLRVVTNDLVLVNLKTGRAYLLKDEDSEELELGVIQELFPDLVPFAKQDQPDDRADTRAENSRT